MKQRPMSQNPMTQNTLHQNPVSQRFFSSYGGSSWGFRLFPILTILMSCGFLVGCTHYGETFDCPAGIGVGCRSLSQVNTLVDQGVLPQSDTEQEESDDTDAADYNDTLAAESAISVPDEPAIHFLTKGSNPTVWLAGYHDSRGRWHSPRWVQLGVKYVEDSDAEEEPAGELGERHA